MKNLATALLAVMAEISHLQSDKTVGTGNSSYKGISDQKATGTIRKALIKHGIVALQSNIEEVTTTENWLEQSEYNGKITQKAKIQVLTRVKATITLIHADSGETATIQAIGHGIDNGDKAAGKAMTYAKKNALLNSLLISTGLDADDIHSDDLPSAVKPAPVAPPVKQTAEQKRDTFIANIVGAIKKGAPEYKQAIATLLADGKFSKEQIQGWVKAFNEAQAQETFNTLFETLKNTQA